MVWKRRLISLMLVLTSSFAMPSRADEAPAVQKDLGILLKAGASANIDLVCYDQSEQAELNGLIAELNSLKDERAAPSSTNHWYQNQWLWFTVGLAVGGWTVGYLSTR